MAWPYRWKLTLLNDSLAAAVVSVDLIILALPALLPAIAAGAARVLFQIAQRCIISCSICWVWHVCHVPFGN